MEITYYPDPFLRKLADPIDKITPAVLKTLDEMIEFMYVANGSGGVGLAAPQIGLSKRLLVMDPSSREDEKIKKPLFFINPVITHVSKEEVEYEEGCLSLPDIFAPVTRPEACIVKYLDRKGQEKTIEADGFLARVIQHELDHLDGKLFIDYLSPLRKQMVGKKLKLLEKIYKEKN
ncbi:MAG: peptide deformylase [Alphaproteobacteria bacterium]|nr:peptide deformylase [Alphaproteobacteria bacterium]MBN2779850.1 peptide deformylase [Alphaproteobacteria bacterium]